MCYSMNHAQGLGAPCAAQALTQPEKQSSAKFFKRDSFLSQVCVVGGHLSAAVAQGRASGQKQGRARPRRAGAVTHLALPPPSSPQILQELPLLPPSHTEKEISLQPALPTRCQAEASATPRGFGLPSAEGIEPPQHPQLHGPKQHPNEILSCSKAGAQVSHLIQGEHPRLTGTGRAGFCCPAI